MKLMTGDSTPGEKPRLKYGWIRRTPMNRALTLLMIACLSLSRAPLAFEINGGEDARGRAEASLPPSTPDRW